MSLAAEAAPDRRRIWSGRRATDAGVVVLTIAEELEIWRNDSFGGKPLIGVIAAACTLPILLRHRFRLAAPVVPAIVFGTASFWVGDSLRELAFPVVVAGFFPFVLGRNNDRPRALFGLAVGYACSLAFVANTKPGVGEIVFVSILGIGPWLAGQALRTREAQARELRELAVQLERERDQRARAARATERLRIARELHDVIAHSISVMTIQAGAARVMLEDDPARAAEPLRRVSETGRQTLGEMRRLLGVLRPETGDEQAEPRPSLANLRSLVEHYRVAGLPVDLDVDGTPKPLGAGLDLAAYRIVQEALTNSLKYAGPATARVHVRFTPEALDLEIADNGKGSGAPSGGKHGLIGMRERVTIYGGELQAGPRRDGGFAVRARLPLERIAARSGV